MNKLLKLSSVMVFILLGGCAVKGDYTCGIPQTGVRCQPMDVTSAQLNDGSLNSLHTDPFPEPVDETTPVSDSTPGVGDNNDSSYISTATSSATDSGKASSTEMPVETLPSIETIHSKQAILSQPREMRIWFARFTDPDGDLHDESFVFVRLDNGHWVIDNKPVLY